MAIRNVFYIKQAEEEVLKLLRENNNKVYYSRQIEVLFERKFYHWITTNQAIRKIIRGNRINSAYERLMSGSNIHLVWDKSFRYYKRQAAKIGILIRRFLVL